MRTSLIALALIALPLTSCGEADTGVVGHDEGANSPADPFIVENGEASGAEAETTPVAAIPEALQGRWGLVEADCDPSRSDAKGMMEVTTDGLDFYESRATLSRSVQRSDQTLRAVFDFSGEGQSWSREVRLDLADGGETLEREDLDGELEGETLVYTRCN